MEVKTLRCFISYSHEDKKMCEKFKSHIKCLGKMYSIECWYDGMIPPRGKIDEEIKRQLNKSDIVFLLVSSSFISSYYCYEKELRMAISQNEKGKCKVIPVIIKNYPSGKYLFSDLKFVPTDGKPITKFKPHDDGFVDALNGITCLLDEFFSKPSYNNRIKKSLSKNYEIKYKIVKNTRLRNVRLTKETFDNILLYNQSLLELIKRLNTLLWESNNRFKVCCQRNHDKIKKNYSFPFEEFILQLCCYIQKSFFSEHSNTCVHIRKKEGDKYCGCLASGYSSNNLLKDPIIAEGGMIECSKTYNMPIIKNFNTKLHKNSHPYEKIVRNYITFTFNNIRERFGVDLSMCISEIGESSKTNEMFTVMSIMRLDLLIEKYIIQYIEHCLSCDPMYDANLVILKEE